MRSAQKAAEDEAATVAEKATEVERMLYGGTITAAKELEAYQADLAMLRQRQSNLEEGALERMEEAEPLEAELGACRPRQRRRRRRWPGRMPTPSGGRGGRRRRRDHRGRVPPTAALEPLAPEVVSSST